MTPISDVFATIQSYLGNGGLFNPEMMEHDKVRDLILACRDHLQRIPKLVKFVEAQECECYHHPCALGIHEVKCQRCALLEEVLSSESLECQRKLPDPTPEQAKCRHEKWRAMLPQPRHCVECGLLMWDAGD